MEEEESEVLILEKGVHHLRKLAAHRGQWRGNTFPVDRTEATWHLKKDK